MVYRDLNGHVTTCVVFVSDRVDKHGPFQHHSHRLPPRSIINPVLRSEGMDCGIRRTNLGGIWCPSRVRPSDATTYCRYPAVIASQDCAPVRCLDLASHSWLQISRGCFPWQPRGPLLAWDWEKGALRCPLLPVYFFRETVVIYRKTSSYRCINSRRRRWEIIR